MIKIREILLCIAYMFFSISGLTLIKMGDSQERALISLFDLSIGSRTICGIICYGISFGLYLFVVSKFNISLALPIIGGLNTVLIVLVGCCVLHNKISLGQALGIGIIILGTVITGCFTRTSI